MERRLLALRRGLCPPSVYEAAVLLVLVGLLFFLMWRPAVPFAVIATVGVILYGRSAR